MPKRSVQTNRVADRPHHQEWHLSCTPFLSLLLSTLLLLSCGGKDTTGPIDDDGRASVTPTVKGAIRDVDGNGLANVVVSARYPSGGSLIHADTTIANGAFVLRLQGFTLGLQIEIFASKPGYRDTSSVIKVESSETIGVFLTLIRSVIVFTGQATDVLAGGGGLSDVKVTVRDGSGASLQTPSTDAAGIYTTEVTGAAGDTFILEGSHVGFAPRVDTVVVQNDSMVVNFSLSLAVVGVVRDAGGQPVENAIVSTVGGTAEGSVATGLDGSYVLTLKQDAGGDTILVVASGFFSGRQWVPFSRTAENRADIELLRVNDPIPQVSPQELVIGLVSDQATFTISNAAEEGDLVWSAGGLPAWLRVSPAAGTETSGDTPTAVSVTVIRDQLPAAAGADAVSDVIELTFNSTSLSSVDIPVSVALRSLVGTVTDISGQPVSADTVSLLITVDDLAPIASGVTGDDGTYGLPRVAAGEYMLVSRAEGHIAAISQITVSGGPEARQDVEMIPFPAPAPMVYESDVPFRILIDPAGDGDRAYVLVRTNPPDNTIKVVSGLSSGSGQTSRAGSDIRVGSNPTDGDFYNGNLVAACYGDTSVWIVDLNTDTTSRILTSPGPFGLTVAGSRAYVACEGTGSVGVLDVINLQTQQRIQSVPLGELVASLGDEPWGPDVSVSGNLVLVTDNQESGRIVIVDLSASPPQVTTSLNVGGRPQAIVELPDGLQSCVINKRDPAGVTVIDRFTGSKVKTITIDGPPGTPQALALSPDPFYGRRLLYLVYGQEVVFYDLEFEAEVGRLKFTEDPTGRAVSAGVTPDGSALLIGLERAPLGQRLLFFTISP
jgi:hypothetical protein